MEGLSRLEYRGYDSAGVALVDRRRRRRPRSAPASSRTSRSTLEAHPLPPSRTGIGHTRWATHGGPTDGNAHPHRGGDDGPARPDPQRHHRELPRPEEGAARRAASCSSRETDTEVAAKLRRARVRPRCGDLTEAMRDVVAAARGRLHAARGARRQPRRRRRRPPQQPARRRPRRRRELPRLRRRGVHRPHPPRARARPGPDRHDHARRLLGHQLRRHPVGRQGLRGHLGRRRRREGRLRHLHGEGDQRPAARGGRHPARPHRRRPAASCSTRCAISEEQLRAVDRITIVACGTAAYAGMVAKYAIEHWTRIPVEVEPRPRVPLPRPDRRRATRSSSRSASPARRWTP